MEEKTKTLREALTAGDATRIREGMQELQSALERAGQAVYSAQQAEAPNGSPDDGSEGGSTAGGTKPGTVEGEFREV